MIKHSTLLFLALSFVLVSKATGPGWGISVLPASVRIDPVSHKVYDQPYERPAAGTLTAESLLKSNWIYNGERASIQGARGEYVSFQLVLTNNTEKPLKGIEVTMTPFNRNQKELNVHPELFLEWSVQVLAGSTGYPKATLGPGWYPDALIPFKHIQQGELSLGVNAWIYPLQLPDFNNRIPNQKSQLIWADQYIPFEKSNAESGLYSSTISVKIAGVIQSVPIELNVLDFALPNENLLKASLQHEGFVSRMNDNEELETYQLMKRNRVAIIDPTYEPELKDNAGKLTIDWTRFDARLKKYFSGEAFKKKHGYEYGPGYGTPIETFLLPFDVYGKHGTHGWPDVGKPDVEKKPENRAKYVEVVRNVRDHLELMVNSKTTDLTVYLDGLDESYFPEAWDRMAYYGDLFKKEYPGTQFRVDGAYTDTAMKVIENSISSWAVHTIEFDERRFKKYADMGIRQWLYGPMIYESKVNGWVGSSTFTDLPLVNDRAISWSAWKYKAYSWLSWGLGAGWKAAWYDTETWKSANDGGNADGYDEKKMNGNALLVYSPGIIPNVKSICPSIRLKTMRNGVQEYEYMRMLATIDKNDKRTNDIVNSIIERPYGNNAVGNINVWNYNPKKWDEVRRLLGELISQSIKNKTN
jgi:hypothetical protein